MFTFPSKIRYSEVGPDCILTLPALVNYFQDCSTFQSEGTCGSLSALTEKNMSWMLSSWQIDVIRYPRLCEDVVIGTIPYELKGLFGMRNFFMKTADGELLAQANSIWALIDLTTGMPMHVPAYLEEAYPIEPKLDMDYAPRKLPFPKDGSDHSVEDITVRLRDLDSNHHMNNEQYIRMALDCLEGKLLHPSHMRAEYKKQAFLGNIIHPVVNERSRDGETIFTVGLNNDDGKAYCNVEFR
ncbi:Acyl-ACP thioesterase [Lachnospiraceae bacterium]|nr:Acyl-ACP thioesterase [Lachnospiraceae bacterium]